MPGEDDALASLCARAGLVDVRLRRLRASLDYATDEEACRAAFTAGPVALAWSRFGNDVRQRVRARYIDAISAWRAGRGYRIPGEFVVAAARVPAALQPGSP